MDFIIRWLFVLKLMEEMEGDNAPGQSEHADNFPPPVGGEGLRLRHKTDVDITWLRSVVLATPSTTSTLSSCSSGWLGLYPGAA